MCIRDRDFSGGREALSLTYQTVSSVSDPMAAPQQILEQLRDHQERHRQAELDARQCQMCIRDRLPSVSDLHRIFLGYWVRVLAPVHPCCSARLCASLYAPQGRGNHSPAPKDVYKRQAPAWSRR